MRRRLGFFFAAFFAKGRRHLRPSSLLNAANEEILRMMSPSNGKAMTSLRSFPRLRRREEEEASAMSLRLLVIRTGNLINLESLNLDSCKIGDKGMLNLKGVNRPLGVPELSLTILEVLSFKPVSVDTISSIAGLTALASLNVSNSRITNAGLQHLKPLKNLRSLTLESCKVTATEIKKLQLAALPNLISVRPE
ncbi:hypothetical protein BHM03_00033621 [Ensete ventricosum]|nr:hypothetical protein BHM03_00033621 [Ensete ventricosum]